MAKGLTNTQASYLIIKFKELIDKTQSTTSKILDVDVDEYKIILEMYKELING